MDSGYHKILVKCSLLLVNPSDVIILEGILAFHDPRVLLTLAWTSARGYVEFLQSGRSYGESMENALCVCCKGIKIGKILIHREGDNGQQLIYGKSPQDIAKRHVLLLDLILGTGNAVVQAISLLIKKGELNIIFLNLISAPQGVHVFCKSLPRIKIMRSELEIEIGLNEDFHVVPGMGEFGNRYIGSDGDDQTHYSLTIMIY